LAIVNIGNAWDLTLTMVRRHNERTKSAAQNCVLLRDGDCSEECILGRRCIRRTVLEQNLPAAAMHESVAPAFSGFLVDALRS
jgi:hypothetical protein